MNPAVPPRDQPARKSRRGWFRKLFAVHIVRDSVSPGLIAFRAEWAREKPSAPESLTNGLRRRPGISQAVRRGRLQTLRRVLTRRTAVGNFSAFHRLRGRVSAPSARSARRTGARELSSSGVATAPLPSFIRTDMRGRAMWKVIPPTKENRVPKRSSHRRGTTSEKDRSSLLSLRMQMAGAVAPCRRKPSDGDLACGGSEEACPEPHKASLRASNLVKCAGSPVCTVDFSQIRVVTRRL